MELRWIALGYNVPINPSRNRVYVWRKLKELGAEYFKQGVAVLPDQGDNLAQLRLLSDKIRQMGGEASLVELKFLDPRDQEDMISRFRSQIQNEYSELLEESRELVDQVQEKPLTDTEKSRLRRTLHRLRQIRKRDHFLSGFTEDVEAGFSELMDTLKDTASDFSSQLREVLKK